MKKEITTFASALLCLSLGAMLQEDFEGKSHSARAFGAALPLTLDASTAASGKQSLRIDYPKGDVFAGINFDPVKFEGKSPEALYIEFHVRLEKPSGKKKHYSFALSGDAQFADGSKKWVNANELGTVCDPNRTGWQKITAVWKPGKALVSFRPKFMFNASGPVWIDGVRVMTGEEAAAAGVKMEAKSADAPGAGMEWSFEDGAMKGVSRFGKGVVSVTVDPANGAPDCGKSSLKLEYAPGDGFGGVRLPAVELNQKTPRPVLLEARAKAEKPSGKPAAYGFGMSLLVTYADGSKKWETGALSKLFFNSGSGDWQTVSLVWTPDKPLKSVVPTLMFNGEGTVWFDLIRVIPMSEVVKKKLSYGIPLKLLQKADFSKGVMPDFLVPHFGRWRIAEGKLESVGSTEDAVGCYLRSLRSCDLGRIRVKLSKRRPEGVVYVHTGSWEIRLDRDELVITDVNKPDWYLTASRPIEFGTGEHVLEVDFLSDRIAFRWDGRALEPWISPEKEYAGKPYGEMLRSYRMEFRNAGQIFVLQDRGAEIRLSEIEIYGTNPMPAAGFIDHRNFRYPLGRFTKDNQFDRIAPLDVVTVSTHDAEASALPPVKGFEITRFSSEKEFKGKHFPVYNVGGNNEMEFPSTLSHPRYNAPVEATIRFNLAEAGDYILRLPVAFAKNLGNVLEAELDGKVILRQVVRGMNSSSALGTERVEPFVKLRFPDAGGHRLTLRYSCILLDRVDGLPSMPENPAVWEKRRGWFWKFGRITFKGRGLGLFPGHEEPLTRLDAAKPQEEHAALSPELTDWSGAKLNLEIVNLPDGPAEVELAFYETVLDSPGERLMDVSVNGKNVLTDFDIVKAAGRDLSMCRKTFPVEIRGGTLRLVLTGKKFDALISAMTVRRNGETVFRHNFGWSPQFANWAYFPRYRENVNHRAIPFAKAGKGVFDGHNLVADPGYAIPGRDNPFEYHYSVKKLRDLFHTRLFSDPADRAVPRKALFPADVELRRDTAHFRSAPAALAIGRVNGSGALTSVFPVVNASKRQEYSFYAKASGANGTLRAGMLFYKQDFLASKLRGEHLTPLALVLSDSVLTGDSDWKKISVSARPPRESALAALLIVVENNTQGTFFVDDAFFDGYGAEKLEITTCHAGYLPNGLQRFLIKSVSDAPVAYRISDSSGKTVRSGRLEKGVRHHHPDRFYFMLKPESVRTEGEYLLRVTQNGETAESRFRIDARAYRRVLELLLGALEVKRFHTDVPFYRRATHFDDAEGFELVFPRFDSVHQVKVLPKTRKILGGFNDAGDRIRHWTLLPAIGFGANAASRLNGIPDLALRARPLAIRAMDNMADAQLEDGFFFSADKPYQYDNIPGYGIERFFRFRVASPLVPGVFAATARALDKADTARRTRYLQAAARTYNRLESDFLLFGGKNAALPFNRLLLAGKMLYNASELLKTTGEARYASDLDRAAAEYAGLVGKRVYLEPGYRNYGELSATLFGVAINGDILFAAVSFLENHPDHPRAEAVRKALRTLTEDIAKASSVEPWEQALDLERDFRSGARLPADRSINYWIMLSYGLAGASRVLNDPALLTLAEQQFQFLLGFNPQDIAVVTGVGDRTVAGGDMLYLEKEFYKGVLAGKHGWNLPGNVPTMGFRAASAHFSRGDTPWGVLSLFPQGFWPMFLDGGYPHDPGPSEFWQVHCGLFTAAASILSDVLAEKK